MFNGSRKFAHFFLKFGNAENHSVISDAISHGDFNRIYCIGMKKDHQTLFNFAILAGKRQKHTLSYKVALKIFMVGPKGGASHRGPPPKYASVYYGSVVTESGYESDRATLRGPQNTPTFSVRLPVARLLFVSHQFISHTAAQCVQYITSNLNKAHVTRDRTGAAT